MSLRSRVAQLEPRNPARQPVIVWRTPGETNEQALARRFGGAPVPSNVLVIGWADSAAGSAGNRA